MDANEREVRAARAIISRKEAQKTQKGKETGGEE
jgi:hypothetical protein